jgi:hypothetical protein
MCREPEHCRWWLTLVVSFAALVACVPPASAAGAAGSPFRRVAPSTVAFASDGTRYAAWQVTADSPVVVLDTRSGRQVSYADGCSLASEQGAPGPPAAAGRFLATCAGGVSLLSAATGAVTALPQPAGPYDGEWREVGTRYVEGNADLHDCAHSAKEVREESRYEGGSVCIALYEIATGALSYRPGSQVPDLDSPGAPSVCRAQRGRLLSARRSLAIGEFAYSQGLLVTLNNAKNRVSIGGCHGRQTVLAAGGEAENLDLAGGLLSWDTAHAGVSPPVGIGGVEERVIYHGTLWSYEPATRRRRGCQLPRETTSLPNRNIHAVLGRSAHAGKTLFWIAAATVNGDETRTVETSSVYAARL